MPQVLASAVLWLVEVGVPIGLIDFGLKVAFSATLSIISSKLFGPKIPDSLESLRGISVMRESSIEYRKVVYGQAAVSGPVVYKNVSGTNREYLWYVVALADGEIEDLVSVYIDGDKILKSQISWSPGVGGADGTGTGNVTLAKFIGSGSTNAAQIYYTLGHSNQVAMTNLVNTFSEWTTNHQLRGISYVVGKFLYNENTSEVWKTGAPQNIRAVIKGRRIYDPRLDSTAIIDSTTSPIGYGTGTHLTTDSSTWEWSDNPALCVADYLFSYMSVPATSIDWEAVAKAADDCDTLVSIPPAASPENQEKRFRCNGVIGMGASHKDNLDQLLSSFDGRLSYTEGKWKIRASVWEASSVSYDEGDLAGPVEVRGSSPKSERFNSVRGVFVDENRDYEVVEFPHITNSTYETRDSREIMYDLELPCTTSASMAQRIAFRLLEQADNQIVAKIKLNARGAKCAIGDVISLSISKLSWSSKTFRVIEWERATDGTFDVTLREDTSTRYDDPLVADYIDGNSANVTIPSDVVPPPTGFSASSVPYAIKLSWTNPGVKEWDFIDVYASSTSAWSGASRIASVRTDTYTHNLGAGTTKYYWLRARRDSGDVSLRTPDSDTSTVTSTSGSATDSVNLAGATLSDQRVASSTEVGYRLTSGGAEESYTAPAASPVTYDSISTWLLSGAASNFESRLTKTSGTDPTGGNLNTWEGLGTTRNWYWTDSTQDDNAVSFVGTIEIRDVAQSPAPVLASAAINVTIDSQQESITLSGGDPTASPIGTPNISPDTEPSGTDATAAWYFNSDGTVDRMYLNSQTPFATGVEWIASGLPSPVPHFIRATSVQGSAPNGGDSLNTWLALSTDRSWTWTKTGGTTGQYTGTIKVEIADGASPQVVLATGYYKGIATVTL